MPMKRLRSEDLQKYARTVTLMGAFVGLGLAEKAAFAQQLDVVPPLPNVMLILDTSGSMEKLIDGRDPEVDATTLCNPAASTTPNRWGVALEALTGKFSDGYRCLAMSRQASTTPTNGRPVSEFLSTYSLGSNLPYDNEYHLPYHRPMTGTSLATACVVNPGSYSGAVPNQPVGTLDELFPANAIENRIYGTANSCNFSQLPDGALDSGQDIMRFGLMTFDSDEGSGVGITGSPPTVSSNPFPGQWSYFPAWDQGAASGYNGWPANCSPPSPLLPFEVGARNPAAPPWEGRMIRFAAPSVDVQQLRDQSAAIQRVILASRPYGATPIAAMLEDARYYFWTDAKGPQIADDYVKGGCRDQYIILLTDGAPNLDLRPSCEAAGTTPGKCPYEKPETTAAALSAGSGGRAVKTFVIGFAVSSVEDQAQTVYCSSLVSNGALTAAGVTACSSGDSKYAACCKLQQIAIAGGTDKAFFADTAGDLQSALGEIIATIGRSTTTRTVPTYAPQVSNPSSDPSNPTTATSMYLSSFQQTPGGAWTGTVQRQRLVCELAGGNFSVPPAVIDENKGDDFAKNLNSHVGDPRNFIAVLPDDLPSPQTGVDPGVSIRPFLALTPPDKLQRLSGTQYAGSASTVINALTPAALKILTNSCANLTNSAWLSTTDCKALALNFAFGQASTNPMPSGFAAFVSRYDTAFADVFHASPAIVGAPSAMIRDESYQAFRALKQTRKMVLFAATNDGLLHAFDTSVSTKKNNELWAFLPPSVMPSILSTYPAGHQLLLDGSPVVQDVVWERTSATLGNATNWHTMLVAGFGSQGRGYYAMDVTDPIVGAGTGPQFRWQLTTTAPGEPTFFGQASGTPAVTTIYVDPDGLGAREIGVAILPGGVSAQPSSGAECARAAKTSDAAPPSGFKYRPKVRCWGPTATASDPVEGRAMVIVRVDTGEVLRVFMRAADAPPSLTSAGRVIDTALDSPMSGAIAAYPAGAGAIAQKFFAGDADGTIWKFDVSSSDPTKWTGELFFDTVNDTVDTSANAFKNGKPIQVPPVISLDRGSNVVIDVATGDQEVFGYTDDFYIYSLSEKAQGSPPKLRASVNWYLKLTDGERVTGPMAVFDGTFYFATFKAVNPSTGNVCSGGSARLWGRDFATPDDLNDLSKGGIRKMQPPDPNPPQNPPPVYIQPSDYDATLAGKVIPGVSVSVTPSCADISQTSSDMYVAGAQHTQASNISSGQYALFSQVGGKNTSSNGAASQTYTQKLASPNTATLVDSWAAVVD